MNDTIYEKPDFKKIFHSRNNYNYRPSSPYKTCIRNLLFIKNETVTYEAEGTQKSKQMKELFIYE